MIRAHYLLEKQSDRLISWILYQLPHLIKPPSSGRYVLSTKYTEQLSKRPCCFTLLEVLTTGSFCFVRRECNFCMKLVQYRKIWVSIVNRDGRVLQHPDRSSHGAKYASLGRVMACCLFGAKPLPEPMGSTHPCVFQYNEYLINTVFYMP